MQVQTRILKPETYCAFWVYNSANIRYRTLAVSHQHARNKFSSDHPGVKITSVLREVAVS